MSVGSDSEIAQRLYNFRFLFLIEGTVLILLGCLAIGVPAISSSTATLAVGWIFLISGIVGFVPMFLAETYPGLWWSLISALLAVLVGIILITNNSQDLYGGLIGWPFRVEALSPLRKVLVMFSLIEGGASIMFAFEHRRQFTARWAWMVLSGIVDLMAPIGADFALHIPLRSATRA
jgi:uncharacterized membrane protein HdeD (DUF308 family)